MPNVRFMGEWMAMVRIMDMVGVQFQFMVQVRAMVILMEG